MFSQHINQTHLDECLDHLISLYDDLRDGEEARQIKKETEFEALHILLSKNISSIYRAWQVPVSQDDHLRNAVEIKLAILSGNFIRANRIAKKLPLILALGYRLRFSSIRPLLLEIYERSHRSTAGSKFPLDKLTQYLLFDTAQETASFCSDFGLSLDNTRSYVVFKTGAFKNNTVKTYTLYDDFVRSQLQDVGIGRFLYGESVPISS